MEFYFLDESGDQGARGSKYLILTLVKLKSAKKAVKIIQEASNRLTLDTRGRKWLEQHGGEIKFTTFPDKNYLAKMMKQIGELKPEITYAVADKGGLPFETEHKILPLLFEAFSGETPVKKIIADLGFVGKKAAFFAMAKRSTQYVDKVGKKINRIEKIIATHPHRPEGRMNL